MPTLASIDRELEALNVKRKALLEQKRERLRGTLIRCTHCHQRSRVRSWTFYQEQYYVSPYSCTGGDYWQDSGRELCHIECPKCGEENYIYNHPERGKLVDLMDVWTQDHPVFGVANQLFAKFQRRQRDN